jgi:hypothetical protein
MLNASFELWKQARSGSSKFYSETMFGILRVCDLFREIGELAESAKVKGESTKFSTLFEIVRLRWDERVRLFDIEQAMNIYFVKCICKEQRVESQELKWWIGMRIKRNCGCYYLIFGEVEILLGVNKLKKARGKVRTWERERRKNGRRKKKIAGSRNRTYISVEVDILFVCDCFCWEPFDGNHLKFDFRVLPLYDSRILSFPISSIFHLPSSIFHLPSSMLFVR